MTELPGCADLELPGVPDVQILRLAPGDTLVVTSPIRLTDQQMDEIEAGLHNKLPGHPVVVLDGGCALSVLRKEG